MLNSSPRLRKGFTLVELMIVIVIIGILMAISIPAYKKIRETAQEKALTSDLSSVYTNAQLYLSEHPEKPSVKLGELIGDYGSIPGDKYGVQFDQNAQIKLDTGVYIEIKYAGAAKPIFLVYPEINGKTRIDTEIDFSKKDYVRIDSATPATKDGK